MGDAMAVCSDVPFTAGLRPTTNPSWAYRSNSSWSFGESCQPSPPSMRLGQSDGASVCGLELITGLWDTSPMPAVDGR